MLWHLWGVLGSGVGHWLGIWNWWQGLQPVVPGQRKPGVVGLGVWGSVLCALQGGFPPPAAPAQRQPCSWAWQRCCCALSAQCFRVVG